MQINFSSPEFLLTRFRILQSELKRRMQEKLFKWKPLPKQELLLKSKSKVTLTVGGNRSGKTDGGVMHCVLYALGLHPYWQWSMGPDGPRPPRIWIIGLDEKSYIIPILLPKIKAAIPSRMIPKFGHDRKNSILILKNGAVIIFKTTKTTGGDDNFQSDDIDLAWFDEEPPEDIYKEVLWRTVDRGGKVLFTMTPTNGMSWTYEKFYKPWADGKGELEEEGKKIGGISVIEMTTYDNLHLDSDSIAAVESLVSSPEEKEMRLYGRYVSMGGSRIFKPEIINLINTSKPKFVGDIVEGPSGPAFIQTDEQNLMVWEDYDSAYDYYAGIDPTEGITDKLCISIFKAAGIKLEQVAEFNALVPLEGQPYKSHYITKYFGRALTVVERNTGGYSIIIHMMNMNDRLYLREINQDDIDGAVVSSQIGIHMTDPLKQYFITNTINLLKEGRLIIRSERLKKQMEAYIRDKRNKIKAGYGHDDCVIGLMLAVEGYNSMQTPINNVPVDPEYALKERDYAESITDFISH